MNTKTIKFDLNKYKLYEKIKAKQGDTKSRFLLFQLLDGSIPFNLTNRSVRAYMVKPDGKEIFNDLIINNYSLGYCTLELTNQVLAVSGTVKIELMVTEEDKKLTSSVFELEVVKSINSEKSIVSTNEFTALLNGLASLSEYDNYKNSVKSMEINKADKAKVEEKFGEVYEQLDTSKQQINQVKADLVEKANEVDLRTQSERIDNLILHSGENAEKDAELVDTRVGADGKTYSTSGVAVREQFKNVNNKVDSFQNDLDYNKLNIDKGDQTHYGVVFTELESGGYNISGTSTENIYVDFGYVDLIGIDNETNLTLSGSNEFIKILGYFRNDRNNSASLGSIYSENGVPKTFNKTKSAKPDNTTCMTFSIYVAKGVTLNNVVIKPIVNIGGKALKYIKYGTAQSIKEYVDDEYGISKSIYSTNEYIENLNWTNGYCLNINGVPVVYDDCSYCDLYIPISDLMLKSTITNLYDRISYTVAGLCFYDKTKAFVGYYSPSKEGQFNIKISDIISQFKDAYYIRLNKLKDSKVKFLKASDSDAKEIVNTNNLYKLNMYENVFIGGDSVTEGFVVDGDIYQVETKYSYPTQLKKIIPHWNITVKAKSGASAVSWRNMFYSSTDFSQYDLIIMELGYNGSDHGYFNMDDINTVGTNTYEYKKLISDIRSQNSTAEILLVLSSKYTNSGDKWDWKPILELVANESNCEIINLRDKKYLDLNLDKYHGAHDGKIDYVHGNRKFYNAKAYVVAHSTADVLD